MKKFSIGLLIFFAALGAFAQSDLQPLAVVKLNKSETITVKQLKTRANFIQKQYGMESLPVEQKQALLENLIAEKLITQAAAKEGLSVTDSQVDDAFLNTFSQQLGTRVSEAQLEDLIKKQTGKSLDDYIKEYSGMSKSEYKAYLKNQLIIQQYVFSKKQSEIQAVAATDEEIRNAYEMNKSTFVWNDMMKLFLVMVPKGSNDMAARALATDLRNKYKGSYSCFTFSLILKIQTKTELITELATLQLQKRLSKLSSLDGQLTSLMSFLENPLAIFLKLQKLLPTSSFMLF